jgi:predicted DCC family thiol-disulfide oxidoreductase YuxK
MRAWRPAYSYRTDPAVPAFPDDRPIVIFDGHCAFCSASVRFLVRADREGRFRLLPAQSDLGRALYVHYGLDPEDYESNVLLSAGVAWFESEGNLRIAETLGLPWSAARVLRLVPAGLRDRGYQFLARNRFRIFGRLDACEVPRPEFRDRFLG